MDEPTGAPHEHSTAELIAMLHERVRQLEGAFEPELRGARAAERKIAPALHQVTEGESRLPVIVAIGVAIGVQLILPRRLVIQPRWLLPGLEAILVAALVIANPGRMNRTSRALRAASVALTALLTAANAYASASLIKDIIDGTSSDNASLLLSRAASIYVTNIIVFALWYWEWDRGGPVERAMGSRPYPDFLFPQKVSPEQAPAEWSPNFIDYLYVSFTNATAFSPTDTMPLARWAKMLMLVQSTIALLTGTFVVARAINILK